MSESTMETMYGVPAMSLKDEMALPVNVKRTMQNKVSIIDKCGLMQRAIDQLRLRVWATPMIDDNTHADAVETWANMTMDAEQILWNIARFGMEGVDADGSGASEVQEDRS